MVAPIDAKVSFEVEGETITLRLDWQSIAMMEDMAVSLFSADGLNLTLSKCATLVKCMTVSTKPEMTLDEALAIVVKHGIAEVGGIILELIAKFGGKPDEGSEGNVEAATAA